MHGLYLGHLDTSEYSKTSNNGPSKKRTTSVQQADHFSPIDFTIEYIFNLQEPNTSQLRTTDLISPRLTNTKLLPKTDSKTTSPIVST